MSFKNKMKNRGFSKLDNLTETPSYITPVQPKKSNWLWLKIAIPVTAGLALIVIPVSILAANGVFVSNTSNKSAAPGDSGYTPDPDYGYDDSGMHGGGSSSEADPAPAEPSSEGEPLPILDNSFSNVLISYQVLNNYVIEVYDYADGYTEPTYTFTDEEAVNIINSIKEIDSDFTAFNTAFNSTTANRNSLGHLMGINHRLKFIDGTHYFIANYYSQFSTIRVDDSAYNIEGSDAYDIMDTHVEMDYDSTFDETIN